MTKMRIAAGVLAMACLGTNAIADSADDNGTTTVCHKGRTVTINESGLRGHLGHGDSEGSCEDRRSAVVMMQCVAQGEGIVVYAVSNSPFVDEGVVPVAGEDLSKARKGTKENREVTPSKRPPRQVTDRGTEAGEWNPLPTT